EEGAEADDQSLDGHAGFVEFVEGGEEVGGRIGKRTLADASGFRTLADASGFRVLAEDGVHAGFDVEVDGEVEGEIGAELQGRIDVARGVEAGVHALA